MKIPEYPTAAPLDADDDMFLVEQTYGNGTSVIKAGDLVKQIEALSKNVPGLSDAMFKSVFASISGQNGVVDHALLADAFSDAANRVVMNANNMPDGVSICNANIPTTSTTYPYYWVIQFRYRDTLLQIAIPFNPSGYVGGPQGIAIRSYYESIWRGWRGLGWSIDGQGFFDPTGNITLTKINRRSITEGGNWDMVNTISSGERRDVYGPVELRTINGTPIIGSYVEGGYPDLKTNNFPFRLTPQELEIVAYSPLASGLHVDNLGVIIYQLSREVFSVYLTGEIYAENDNILMNNPVCMLQGSIFQGRSVQPQSIALWDLPNGQNVSATFHPDGTIQMRPDNSRSIELVPYGISFQFFLD